MNCDTVTQHFHPVSAPLFNTYQTLFCGILCLETRWCHQSIWFRLIFTNIKQLVYRCTVIWLFIALASRTRVKMWVILILMTTLTMIDGENNAGLFCEEKGWQTGFNEHSGVTVSGENGNEASIYLCKGYVPIS